MSRTEVTVEGTLREDGTVELDAKPALPPGRVTVVLRQEAAESAVPQENWFEYMLSARKELERAGSHFMDEAELRAHIEWLREPDRIDDMLRELDQGGHEPGRPGC